MNSPDPILDFWFGDSVDNDAAIANRQSSLWWDKSPATDEAIRKRFEAQVQAAADGLLDAWKDSPEGWLALILLTDQFPRNIHRGTPESFGFDPVARTLCLDGIEAGVDQRLRPIQRVFFYLPLEHSESMPDQQLCVDLMRSLARSVPEDQRPPFDHFVDFAVAHRRVIERFGRFPHRNEILGRDSTDEEVEFLKQPGSSF